MIRPNQPNFPDYIYFCLLKTETVILPVVFIFYSVLVSLCVSAADVSQGIFKLCMCSNMSRHKIKQTISIKHICSV